MNDGHPIFRALSFRNFRRIATPVLFLALIFEPFACVARSGQAVAFVELIAPPNRKLEQVARIFRHNRKVPAQDVTANGLDPGDRIFIIDADAVMFIRYFSNNRLAVLHRNLGASPGTPELIVAAPLLQPPPSIFARILMEAMRVASGKQANTMIEPTPDSENYVVAATRSVTTGPIAAICPNPTGLTNEPVRFRAAALSPFENRVGAGQRALFVQWRGGIEPYAVALSDAKRRPIAEMHDLRGSCSATLPVTELADGSLISLTLQDGNGGRAVIPQIEVVASVPAMPDVLGMAKISPEARTLYYATWLTTQDDGVWTFAAVQMVNDLGCSSPAAVDWLSRYGTSSCAKPGFRAAATH